MGFGKSTAESKPTHYTSSLCDTERLRAKRAGPLSFVSKKRALLATAWMAAGENAEEMKRRSGIIAVVSRQCMDNISLWPLSQCEHISQCTSACNALPSSTYFHIPLTWTLICETDLNIKYISGLCQKQKWAKVDFVYLARVTSNLAFVAHHWGVGRWRLQYRSLEHHIHSSEVSWVFWEYLSHHNSHIFSVNRPLQSNKNFKISW